VVVYVGSGQPLLPLLDVAPRSFPLHIYPYKLANDMAMLKAIVMVRKRVSEFFDV